jgi:hypothetical protein
VIGITPIFIVTEISLQSVLFHRIIAGYSHELTSLQMVFGIPALSTAALTLVLSLQETGRWRYPALLPVVIQALKRRGVEDGERVLAQRSAMVGDRTTAAA